MPHRQCAGSRQTTVRPPAAGSGKTKGEHDEQPFHRRSKCRDLPWKNSRVLNDPPMGALGLLCDRLAVAGRYRMALCSVDLGLSLQLRSSEAKRETIASSRGSMICPTCVKAHQLRRSLAGGIGGGVR